MNILQAEYDLPFLYEQFYNEENNWQCRFSIATDIIFTLNEIIRREAYINSSKSKYNLVGYAAKCSFYYNSSVGLYLPFYESLIK